MKRIILSFILVAVATPAFAADLTCTVPTAFVSRAVELCEELRLVLHVRTADWSNSVCATEFLRLGLLEGEKKSTGKASRATVSQAVNDAVNTFQTNFPRTAAATCGDGTLDTEAPFGEECDDGNNVSGDGCSDRCANEP